MLGRLLTILGFPEKKPTAVERIVSGLRQATLAKSHFEWDDISRNTWACDTMVDNYRVCICRLIRGTLVEVYVGNRTIIAYADQVSQYNGLLGVGDLITSSDTEVELLLAKLINIGVCTAN